MRNHSVAQSLWKLIFSDLPTRPALLSMSILAGLVLFGTPLFGQGNSNSAPGRLGLPEDWTSQHVVFSPPRSPQAAAALQKNQRYLHQLLRRNSTHGGPKSKALPKGDWSLSMGRAGSSIDTHLPKRPVISLLGLAIAKGILTAVIQRVGGVTV